MSVYSFECSLLLDAPLSVIPGNPVAHANRNIPKRPEEYWRYGE
jgi:hypothetical protein